MHVVLSACGASIVPLLVFIFPLSKIGGGRVPASGKQAHTGFLKYGLQRGGHFKDCLEAGVPLIAGIMINTSVNRDADSGNTNERYKPK